MNRNLRSFLRYANRGEEGQTIILVAVLMTALLGFAGLVLDFGQAAWEHRQAQNAADAAALSAALTIYNGGTEAQATTKGQQLAQQHGFDTWDLPALTYLGSSGASTATASSVQTVKATVTDTFGTTPRMRFLGVGSVTVKGYAASTLNNASGGNCAICLLSATQGFVPSGGATMNVTGGNIWIDDAQPGAITSSGTTSLSATQIGIVAVAPTDVNSSGSFSTTPAITAGATPVSDPLANVPAPSVSTAGTLASGTSGCQPGSGTLIASGSPTNCTLNPGTWSQFILSGGGTITFNPGTYVFTSSFVIGGNWNFVGSGVTLYFTCSGYSSVNTQPCNNSAGAGLTWSGTTTYQITAPTSGTYKGLAIYYDRTNTAGITLSGAPSDNFTGTIYAKQAAGTWSGTQAINQMNSMIILDHLTTSGSTTITDSFTSSANYQVNSPPVLSQ